MDNDFDAKRAGSGTAQWAEVTENIARGCANGCLYCYAAHHANRFKLKSRGDWTEEELTRRAQMASYPARGGVVMFPSAHDITPFTVEPFIRVARLILKKGNRLLIVTKPREECMRRVMAELEPWKSQVMFRFTIGTWHEEVARFWEPMAPAPGERWRCLVMASEMGWQTSVSMEPMIDCVSHTIEAFHRMKEYVSDTIWIGKMNKVRSRVDMSKPGMRAAVEFIEAEQCDGNILRLVRALEGESRVRWKESIVEVIARHTGPEVEPRMDTKGRE